MMRRPFATLLPLLLVAGAVPHIGACNERGHSAASLDIAAPEAMTAEQEWLSKLQMVRVQLEGEDETTEMNDSEFRNRIEPACADATETESTDPCSGWLRLAHFYLCQGKTLLAAANAQSTPLSIPATTNFPAMLVPEQSEETNAALAERAVTHARFAMEHVLWTLGDYTDTPVPADDCQGESWAEDDEEEPGTRTHAEAYTSTYADAFQLAQDAYDRAIEANLNVSDKMRSTSVEPQKAGARSVAGEKLSRAAAAHLLVGGDPGLDGDTTQALCNTGQLSPQAKTALKILRDAGVAPQDVLDTSLDTESEFLNGTLERGSVLQRLKQFYDYPELVDVGSFYKIDLASFQAARAHLAEEIEAFSRSHTAQLPPEPEDPEGWRRYAGTSSEPRDLPDVAWSVRMARQDSDISDSGFDDLRQTDEGFRQLIGRGVVEARRVLSWVDTYPTSVQKEGFAPLAMIAAAPEHRGYASLIPFGTGLVASAHGYSIDDRVRIVVGEDGLRCALEGTIEGADCSDAPGAPTASYPCEAGEEPTLSCLTLAVLDTEFTGVNYDFGDRWVVAGVPFPGLGADTSYYLIKPRTQASAEQPGQFEALAGERGIRARFVPIVSGLDERVGDLMGPSTENCSVPEVSCAGVTMDARLPLEDELATDADGVENSWRHYLALARRAADEADLLGQEYLDANLNVALNDVQVEIRQEEQAQQAEETLQQVQAACGTAIESRKLLELLSGADPDAPQSLEDVMNDPSESCEVDSDCQDAAYKCVAGTCIVDIGELAKSYAGPDAPDLQRLVDCLDDSDEAVADWVTLGDQPLCVYEAAGNPNVVCPEGTEPCPRLVGDGCPAPDDGVELKQAEPLGYFQYSEPPPAAGNPCDDLRTLRDLLDVDSEEANKQRREAYERFADSNIVHPTRLFRYGTPQLGWHARYGGFASVSRGDVSIYSTGDVEHGPNLEWPCATAPRPGCSSGSSALFCEQVACTDPNARAAINRRLLRAVLATHVIRGGWYTNDLGEISETDDLLVDNHVPRVADNGSCADVLVGYNHLYHYSSHAPINVCNLAGTEFAPSSPTSPTADGWWWPQPGSSEAIFYSAVDGMNFPVQKHPDYGWARFRYRATGNTAAPTSRHAFLSGLYDREGHPPDRGSYMYQYLVEKTSGWIPATFEYAVDGDHILINNEAFDKSSFVDGVELLCELESKRFALGSGSHSEINEMADLEAAGEYLKRLGADVESSAASIVFARVPRVAFDAMREASATGVFPGLGGQMGVEVAALRAAMLRTRDALPIIGSTITQIGAAIGNLRALLEIVRVDQELAEYQLLSTISSELTNCASTIGVESMTDLGTVATCANAAVQIAIATQVNDLQVERADLEGEVAKAQAQDRMAQLASTLQLAALDLKESMEQIDGSLASIENLKKQAKLNLAKAVYQASWQAERQAEVTTFSGTLATGKQIRYKRALKNAKLMAFMAKRAIEQRLGVNLADMRDPLPLVDAPYRWEGSVCTLSGLNYGEIVSGGEEGAWSFHEGFIGDYVTKLENLVESYRLENSFHEGRDIAVISLRDDVFNVRRTCDVEGKNLLLQAGQLNHSERWAAVGCDGDPELGGARCIAAIPMDASPVATLDPGLSGAAGYELRFGDGQGCDPSEPVGPCRWQSGAAVAQQVRLGKGRYRLSWYSQEDEGEGGSAATIVQVLGEGGELTHDSFEFFPAALTGDWNRAAVEFTVAEDADYFVGFGADSATLPTASATIAGPMLENLPATEQEFELTSFQNTGDTTLVPARVCEDTDGAIFRATEWKRDCVRICDAGFSNNCTDGPLYCYREASFGIAQSWIENGRLFNYSGFARGNFNYRIEDLALNFVGTGIRDCGDETMPTACYAAGYVPYSLEHSGPFFVRNHYGDDYRAYLFDGNIEHARGLATERYLSNPLSSADRELLTDYMRTEFQGRPLDGNFFIRVWEEPGADFEAIEDVQLVLNYRYWTRFE